MNNSQRILNAKVPPQTRMPSTRCDRATGEKAKAIFKAFKSCAMHNWLCKNGAQLHLRMWRLKLRVCFVNSAGTLS